MQVPQAALKFAQLLPSALTILVLGGLLSFLLGGWTWHGNLGAMAWPLGVLLGSGIYAISYFISTSQRVATQSMRDLLQTLHDLFQNLSWPQIVVLSFLAGVGEELLLRGVLQVWLVSMTTPVLGILLASVIFGLLHYMSKTYVLLTFALGLLFGIAFHFSNSMLLVVIAHTVYDIFAFALIVKFPHLLGLRSKENILAPIRESSL